MNYVAVETVFFLTNIGKLPIRPVNLGVECQWDVVLSRGKAESIFCRITNEIETCLPTICILRGQMNRMVLMQGQSPNATI